MTVEAKLTRELGIRFIDARTLVTEAKLAEGLVGYPTPEQQTKLLGRAISLFAQKSAEDRKNMKQMSFDLETVKSSQHSVNGRRRNGLDSSDHSVASTRSGRSSKSGGRSNWSNSASSSKKNNEPLLRKFASMTSLRRSHLPSLSPKGNASFKPPINRDILKRISSREGISVSRARASTGNFASAQSRLHTRASLPYPMNAASGGSAKEVRVKRLSAILDMKIPA